MLIGNIGGMTSEPRHIKRSDTGIPVVPLLQESSEDLLVASPARDDTGIRVYLVRQQLKSFCDALGVARTQRAALSGIVGHQLGSPPVGRSLLHVSQSVRA
jgi:hypothetical protein